MRNLLILLLLAVTTWLSMILWDSPPDFFLRDDRSKQAALPRADSYMKNPVTTRFGEDGRRAYLLTGKAGVYFKAGDRFQLEEPELRFEPAKQGGPPWRLTADNARSEEQGSRILLSGAVHAWQNGSDGRSEIFTNDIDFDPQTNTAETAADVRLVHPRGVTTATGMVADFDQRTYRLNQNVESTLYGR